MSLLHGRLSLHDIQDVEGFCTFRLARAGHIDDFEDALAWMIGKTWEASLRYDPNDPSGSTFANYAAPHVFLADYLRERDGRTTWKFKGYTHRPPRPQLLPLEEQPETGVEPEPAGELRDLLGL